jgi:nucleoside-diphosphate-sugar epimerase
MAVNCAGTLNLLEATRQQGVERFVHTSTSETYGTAQYTPIDENHPLRGQSPYAASKIGVDKLAESYHLSFGVPVATIQPFNTYGPRQSARAVIPTIISQSLTGEVIRLGSLSRVSVRQVMALLHASFRPRLETTPFRFANPSPPSGWVEDFHLQAAVHARHTKKAARRRLSLGVEEN